MLRALPDRSAAPAKWAGLAGTIDRTLAHHSEVPPYTVALDTLKLSFINITSKSKPTTRSRALHRHHKCRKGTCDSTASAAGRETTGTSFSSPTTTPPHPSRWRPQSPSCPTTTKKTYSSISARPHPPILLAMTMTTGSCLSRCHSFTKTTLLPRSTGARRHPSRPRHRSPHSCARRAPIRPTPATTKAARSSQ